MGRASVAVVMSAKIVSFKNTWNTFYANFKINTLNAGGIISDELRADGQNCLCRRHSIQSQAFNAMRFVYIDRRRLTWNRVDSSVVSPTGFAQLEFSSCSRFCIFSCRKMFICALLFQLYSSSNLRFLCKHTRVLCGSRRQRVWFVVFFCGGEREKYWLNTRLTFSRFHHSWIHCRLRRAIFGIKEMKMSIIGSLNCDKTIKW